MKNPLFIIIASLLITSCTSVRYHVNYKFKLSEVKKTEKDLPIQIDSLIDPLKNIKANYYSDSTIEIFFTPTNEDIHFAITNLTNQNLKLVWDESVITINNSQSKVIHNGVRLINRNEYQQPSIIYPNQTFKDRFVPTENISWQDGQGGQLGGWNQEPLLINKNYINSPVGSTEVFDSTQFVDYVTLLKNSSTIQINMPILVDDIKRKDYHFTFKVIYGVITPVNIKDRKKVITATWISSVSPFVILLWYLTNPSFTNPIH